MGFTSSSWADAFDAVANGVDTLTDYGKSLWAKLLSATGRPCNSREDFSVTDSRGENRARAILNANVSEEDGEKCASPDNAHHIMPLSGENYKRSKSDPNAGQPKFPDIISTRQTLQDCLWNAGEDDGLNSSANGICLTPAAHNPTRRHEYFDKINCVLREAYNERQDCDDMLAALESVKEHLANNINNPTPANINGFGVLFDQCATSEFTQP